MSDAIAAIGSAAVTTVGTVAVAGMATKAITRATGGGGSRTRKSGNYNVWKGNSTRKSGSKRSKSMMGW